MSYILIFCEKIYKFIRQLSYSTAMLQHIATDIHLYLLDLHKLASLPQRPHSLSSGESHLWRLVFVDIGIVRGPFDYKIAKIKRNTAIFQNSL